MTTSSPRRNVIDAHARVWFLVGSPKLGTNAHLVLEDPQSALYLPITALAEVCWLVERGKVPTIGSVATLLSTVDADPRVTIVPLDRAILDISQTLLSISEMHDRQIVATALHLAGSGDPIALLTCDANITASGLVPIIW